MNMQATTAKSLGTIRAMMTSTAFPSPQKLLPVPSRVPSRTAGVISPSQALSASTTPDPFTLLKDTRERPNSADPLCSSPPLHSPPSPLIPLPEENQSRSSPLHQIITVGGEGPQRESEVSESAVVRPGLSSQ
ncbi:hypothetical protein GJAV_G00056310 [Gymnothorax javanicus]|nr:hypothetical protein GJAV_G00056310 [Gymnothorax javanicus]